MARGEREEYQNRGLQQQVKYAYENAPAMKAKLDKAGITQSDIRTTKDLERIPITSKDQLIDLRKANPPWGGLLGVPPERLKQVFMSPGPIYDPGRMSEDFYRRWAKAYHAGGFRKGDLVVNTWSYHMVPAGHMMQEGMYLLGCTVIPMGVGNTELQVQVLRDTKATGWVGTAGFFMTIVNKAEELGYDVRRDFALRVAAAGLEMAGGPMRRLFKEKYGLITCDQYGTADVGALAYECSQTSGMHICDDVVLEIVDPTTGKQLGPGEVGEVVVTPFDETYPLIRFGTGDLSSYIDEPCPCGRTSLRLTRIMGRVGDAVRTRGMFIHPRQISEVASKFPEISRYQAVVTRPQFRDELVIKIELANENINREKLTEEFGKKFQDVCRLRLDRFEFVPKGTIPEGAKGIVDQRTYE
jgi:phenylacetate-CoA ligase